MYQRQKGRGNCDGDTSKLTYSSYTMANEGELSTSIFPCCYGNSWCRFLVTGLENSSCNQGQIIPATILKTELLSFGIRRQVRDITLLSLLIFISFSLFSFSLAVLHSTTILFLISPISFFLLPLLFPSFLFYLQTILSEDFFTPNYPTKCILPSIRPFFPNIFLPFFISSGWEGHFLRIFFCLPLFFSCLRTYTNSFSLFNLMQSQLL